jgi:hypothetical protein
MYAIKTRKLSKTVNDVKWAPGVYNMQMHASVSWWTTTSTEILHEKQRNFNFACMRIGEKY